MPCFQNTIFKSLITKYINHLSYYLFQVYTEALGSNNVPQCGM